MQPVLFSDGFIHTMELRIMPRKGIDVQQNFIDKKHPKRVAKGHSGINRTEANRKKTAAVLQFNPNKEGEYSKFTNQWLTYGICPTANECTTILCQWAEEHHLETSDIHIVRADFACDCSRTENADLFKKLSDMLVMALICKYDIQSKDQYCATDILMKKDKSITATHKPFQFTCYNKAIQSPTYGVVWRLELRYMMNRSKEATFPNDIYCRIQEMLAEIIAELHSLDDWYETVKNICNDNLIKDYEKNVHDSKEKLSINQFLAQNQDRVFDRQQVRMLFCDLGATEKESATKADNFSDRYHHLYISKRQFKAFIDSIAASIQRYIGLKEAAE